MRSLAARYASAFFRRRKLSDTPYLLWLALLAAFAIASVGCSAGGDGEPTAPPVSAPSIPAEEPPPAPPAPAPPAELPSAEREPPAESESESESEPEPIAEPPPVPPDPISLGILADCDGPFAAWFEDSIGGAQLPLIERGATPSGTNPSEGIEASVVAGRPIEIVGYGCGADSASVAVDEARRLVEDLDAEIVIGAVSGAEGFAIAKYSLERPDVTFIDGTSPAQATTLGVQSENFFRWNGDFAQWSAGLGEFVFNERGWREAVTVAEESIAGQTSTAGFISEFCSVGGQITNRLWPRPDPASYLFNAAQLTPDDNVFVALGGAALAEFLRVYEAAVVPIDPVRFAGNFSWNDPLLRDQFGERVVGIPISDSIWADSDDSNAIEYAELVEDVYPSIAPNAHTVFVYGYYTAAEAMLRALEEADGVLELDRHRTFRQAMAELEFDDAPYGPVRLDLNRQAIVNNFVKLVTPKGAETIRRVAAVTQDFGGTFTRLTPPPDRENPPCEQRELPWVGSAEPVGSDSTSD